MFYTSGLRAVAVAGLVAGSMIVAGCGGSSSSTTTINYTLTSATGEIGQADFSGGKPNRGGAADANTLSSPFGSVAADPTTGLFYIADNRNNRVLGFNTTPTGTNPTADFVIGQADGTSTSPEAGGSGPTASVLAFPTKVSVSAGKLAVTDSHNNRILIWNTLPRDGSTPANVVVGQADFTTKTSGTSATTLNTPTAAMIAGGYLIVVDQGNNRVLIWNSIPTSNGQPADVVLGQGTDATCEAAGVSCFSTSSFGTTQSTFQQPTDVWTDGFSILIADTTNDRVMYFNGVPATNGANATYVMGQTSFTFFAPAATSTGMNNPAGVGSDGNRIFVADSGNNRVLVFESFPNQMGPKAYAVLGQENFTHHVENVDDGDTNNPQDGANDTDRTPTARTLFGPTAAAGINGLIYVTDYGNNRIMIFSSAPPPPA